MKTRTITIKVPVISLPKVTMPITIARNPSFKMPSLPKVKMPFAIKRQASEK